MNKTDGKTMIQIELSTDFSYDGETMIQEINTGETPKSYLNKCSEMHLIPL